MRATICCGNGVGLVGQLHSLPSSNLPWQLKLPTRTSFESVKQIYFHSISVKSRKLYGVVAADAGAGASPYSAWDDAPFEVLPNGEIAYLDEQDVVTFLDPPKELIPLDPSSYSPASYLWKKIEDIPEERRCRLVSLLNPRLISRAWEIAGTRYDDPKLAMKRALALLSNADQADSIEFWNCRTSGGNADSITNGYSGILFYGLPLYLFGESQPYVFTGLSISLYCFGLLPISWINFFKKVLFICRDGKTYGRLIGGSLLSGISNSLSPLYFAVREVNEVMSTEQPCDFAYEFGDGLWDLPNYPQGFPKPVKHPWPFNDQVVIYVRHVGPGVLVGQAWQEGEALEQVPTKLCGEILMMKDYPL